MENLLSKFKIKSKDKTHKGHLLTNPHKHWVIILKVCFIMIFGLILFNLYLLYQIKNEQIFQAIQTSAEKKSPIKEKLLKSVTDSFLIKENKLKDLQSNPVKYTDPSL